VFKNWNEEDKEIRKGRGNKIDSVKISWGWGIEFTRTSTWGVRRGSVKNDYPTTRWGEEVWWENDMSWRPHMGVVGEGLKNRGYPYLMWGGRVVVFKNWNEMSDKRFGEGGGIK